MDLQQYFAEREAGRDARIRREVNLWSERLAFALFGFSLGVSAVAVVWKLCG